MSRHEVYLTDLSDAAWEVIKDLIPKPKPGGRPRTLDMRKVVNAILYIVVGGIQWRMLPHDDPQWPSVYHSFRQWRDDGTWERIHDTLRAQVRAKAGRHKHPTAGCLDSHSVKTTQVPGERGFDSGKQVKGRKRPLLVDTLGLLLVIVVTAASVSDPTGARQVFQRLTGAGKKLRRIGVDGTYRGALLDWVISRFRFILQPVMRNSTQKGFVLLARRWVVERTLGWLNLHRRLSKNYEVLSQTSEAMIRIAMIKIMLNRLAA
ncbi:MAG: IS5 family transposase [Candidatus Competibacteraceae bacterium]|nr:IS5 family transposase [Candidatus Competibacteraceae bacterium]MCB1771287.1 IS5 family transposase [Candidatus Competibacteraceae bacterium]